MVPATTTEAGTASEGLNTREVIRMTMATKYHVLVEKDDDGWYVATVKELRGCVTQGKTRKQAMERIEEAIVGYLEAKNRAVPPTKFVILEPVAA